MVDLVDFIVNFGRLSLQTVWIPVLIWTVVAGPLYAILRKKNLKLAAQSRFVLSTVLLFALPAGILMASFVEPIRIQIPHSSTVPNDTSLSMSPEMAGGQIGLDTAEAFLPSARRAPSIELNWFHFLLGCAATAALMYSLVGAGRMIFNSFQLRRFAGSCEPITSGAIRGDFARAISVVGIRQKVRLYRGPNEMAPMTYGVVRPIVIIPDSMASKHAESGDTWLSLIHELTHIKRRDFAVSVTTKIITAVGGWHPMVRSLKEDNDLYRELACDAELLHEHETDSPRYAQALMRVSTLHRLQPALSMSSPRPVLLHRIKTINEAMTMDRRPSSRKYVFTMGAIFLLLPTLLAACIGFGDNEADVYEEVDATVVSYEESEQSLEKRLIILETEYAYLEAQYDEVSSKKSIMKAQDMDPSSGDYNKLLRRSNLLKSMMDQRARPLEEIRMNVMVGKVLESR